MQCRPAVFRSVGFISHHTSTIPFPEPPVKTMRFAAEDAGIIAHPGSMVMWRRSIITCSNAGIFIVLFVSRLKTSDDLSVERFPMTSTRQIASG